MTQGVRSRFSAISFITLLLTVGALYPYQARAGIFADVRALVQGKAEASVAEDSSKSVQMMPLLKPAMNLNPVSAKGGGEVIIIDESALLPEEGPSGTIADIEKPKNANISLYVVREGDTLSGIAELFGVPSNTILWANNIPANGHIRIGQTLTILPIAGVKYKVQKGDTLESVAKRFKGNAEEIANYNGILGDLALGAEIIIPDGELATPAPAPARKLVAGTQATSYAGFYMRPLAGGVRTQGVHGYNGVDIAAPVGTPILSAAAGEVIVAREGGWNGGYGSYVVVRHNNGTQTLYAHASSIIVGVGQQVVQGQVIGYVGNSGKSTGPHLHFEIRGGPRNPF